MYLHITILLRLNQQTYYIVEMDLGTPKQLKWSFLQQLRTAKNR